MLGFCLFIFVCFFFVAYEAYVIHTNIEINSIKFTVKFLIPIYLMRVRVRARVRRPYTQFISNLLNFFCLFWTFQRGTIRFSIHIFANESFGNHLRKCLNWREFPGPNSIKAEEKHHIDSLAVFVPFCAIHFIRRFDLCYSLFNSETSGEKRRKRNSCVWRGF